MSEIDLIWKTLDPVHRVIGNEWEGGLSFDPQTSKWRDATELNFGGITKLTKGNDPTNEPPEWQPYDDETLITELNEGMILKGAVKFMWPGKSPLVNCRIVVTEPYTYAGEASPNEDIQEISKDWPKGVNRYPTPCQIFEELKLTADESGDETTYTSEECYDKDGSPVTLVGCVPCYDGSGEITNWVTHENETIDGDIAKKALQYGILPMTPGGIYICQKWNDLSTNWSNWELLTSDGLRLKASAFEEEPNADGVILPDRWGMLFICICIPFDANKGGRRSFGLSIECVTLELLNG